MNATFISKTANAIQAYATQTAKEHMLIATEFVTPATADNRALAIVYYGAHWALAIEMAIKCRKAYKANGWTGVGKQYLLSAGKAWAVDHVVRRNIAAIMAANVLAAEASAKAAEADTTAAKSSSDFNVEMDEIVKRVFQGVELQLNSSL